MFRFDFLGMYIVINKCKTKIVNQNLIFTIDFGLFFNTFIYFKTFRFLELIELLD